jgi:uncharacterized protein with HEPN domain
MSKSPNREWHFYIDDMICFAQKVLNYGNGLEQESFICLNNLHNMLYPRSP